MQLGCPLSSMTSDLPPQVISSCRASHAAWHGFKVGQEVVVAQIFRNFELAAGHNSW